MTQIEFLDDLGRELDGAAGRLIRARRTRRHRALLAPAAGLAAVVALAVALWPGAPGDPEREVAAPQEAQAASDLLAVLRRPERQADRGPATRQGRQALARMMPAGAEFRLLHVTPEGEGIVLGAGAVERPGGLADGDGVCLHVSQREGGGGTCWAPRDLELGRAYTTVGARVAGLARDGVDSVELQWAGRQALGVGVRDNLFQVHAPWRDPLLSVTMLDEDGRIVSRHHPAAADVRVAPVPEESVRAAEALAAAPDLPVPGEHLPEQVALAAVAAEVAKSIPYPPGLEEDHDWSAVPRDRQDMASINNRNDVQRIVEYRAYCAWQRFWLAAHDAADLPALAAAVRVLETIPRWPTSRGGPSEHQRRLIEAARGNAAGLIAQEVARNCAAGVMRRSPGRPGRR